MPELIIGIDLGTTNSVVSVLEGDEPIVIPTAEGRNLCPSVVGFTPGGERVVGDIARRQLLTHPARTFVSIKRYMGTRHTVEVDGRRYTPPEIAAMILQKLRADAEAYLGTAVAKAVITVPAYFSDAQRQATRDAGRIAGLDVVRIINEPTAAALAYGLGSDEAHTVLVWDLGGGTFDVSILAIDHGDFEVRATCGDSRLGGDDWDGRLMRHLLDNFQEKEGVDLTGDRLALQRLKEAAEQAKIALSTQETTTIFLPFLTREGDKARHLRLPLNRNEFETLTADLFRGLLAPTETALTDAGLTPDTVDAVMLVGGSTRMPAVQRMAREVLKHDPIYGVNPDEVVALGAAIQGGIISGALSAVTLHDVTPLSLGIETAGGIFTRLIPRNTTIPTSAAKTFSTSRDQQTKLDIHVLQGERDLAKHNKSLGKFTLQGLPPALRGVPRIEVAFAIDDNGIVQISAVDQATGARQDVTLTASSGLTEQEIQGLVVEAQRYVTEDRAQVELVETQQQGEALLHMVTITMATLSTPLTPPDAKRLATGIDRLTRALGGDNLRELYTAVDGLRDMGNLLLHGITLREMDKDAPPPLIVPTFSTSDDPDLQ